MTVDITGQERANNDTNRMSRCCSSLPGKRTRGHQDIMPVERQPHQSNQAQTTTIKQVEYTGEPAYDVVVVGAGAAGLAATRLLTQHGLSVALIEARERIGGRIRTIRPAESAIPLELGASFVHGCPPETLRLAHEAGVTLYELDGQPVSIGRSQGQQDQHGNDEESEDEEGDEENPILASLATYKGEDMALDAYIATYFSAPHWEEARRWTRHYVAGFDAADPATVSVRWLAQSELASERIRGDRQFFVLDGYDRLMQHILNQCDSTRLTLHLRRMVQRIAWTPGQVRVETIAAPGEQGQGDGLPDPMTITARRAIVTIPLSLLKAPQGTPGSIAFDPAPPGFTQALAGLAMGEVVRVVLRLRERFWDRDVLAVVASGASVIRHGSLHEPHMSFLFSEQQMMPTWWTNYPLLVPLLTGWVGGPQAALLAKQSDEEITRTAITSLAAIAGWSFDAMQAEVVAVYLHNWSKDIYTRGAYSYLTVGGMEGVAALAQPFADTLYFAGEATNTDGNAGTVHGALATGERAAQQIIEALSPRL